MMRQLGVRYRQSELLAAFDVPRSSYQYRRTQSKRIDSERVRLKDSVKEIHAASRGAAGARSISGMLKQQGELVGRYKVTSLMREAGLVSKQLTLLPPNLVLGWGSQTAC